MVWGGHFVCVCVWDVSFMRLMSWLVGRQAMSVFVQRLRSCAVLSIDSTGSTC